MNKILKKIIYELQFKNTNYYTRISDKFFKTFYNYLLRKRISKLNPITVGIKPPKFTLAILSNKKNFYESIATIYSLCFWEPEIDIHYHEDGTLTEKEFEFLNKIFPGLKIFKRINENEKVGNYLLSKNLPNCAKLREHFLFSIRLFDMILEKKTKYLIQIDSDVLFFSKPNEILKIIDDNILNGCFNQDNVNSYSFSNEVGSKYIGKNTIDNFNAGLFLHNFDENMFDLIENVTLNEPESTKSWHLEQTIFAMYASVKGDFVALPKEYDICRRERNKGSNIISEHYTHNTGYEFHMDFIYKLYPKYK